MNKQCYRCKRFTRYPLTVEFKDEDGIVRWRITLCWDCQEALAKEVEDYHDGS